MPDTLLSAICHSPDNAVKLHQCREVPRQIPTLKDLEKHFRNAEKDIQTTEIGVAPVRCTAVQVSVQGETFLKLEKDMAGLDNITVSAGGDTLGFIFDTGANLSTICLSVAETMGMHIIPSEILVGSITGEKVPAQLAVCRQLKIGHIAVDHVVFLVLPDEQLTFPQIGYKIRGILGIPILEAFGEIQITGRNHGYSGKSFKFFRPVKHGHGRTDT